MMAGDDSGVRPALPDQSGIWLDQERSGAACAYNIGGAIWIDAALDASAFKNALRIVAGWHDALRLSFDLTEAGLTQRAAPAVPVPVDVVDCSAEADPEAAARRQIALRFNQAFDIARPGLFRFDLLKLGERRWCWLNVYSHLVCDGWGISLITRQVLEAYATLLGGGAPERPAGGGWVEHVDQEQAYYQSERCRQDAAYWLGIHQPPSPPLFSRRQSGGHGSRTKQVFLSRDRYARLTDFAKAQDTTANSLFLAAIYACFARNEGQWDLSIGLPTLNRRTARAKQTVGLFATMNALRCRYAPEFGFGALMREIGADLRRGYRHQRYPLAELNRQLTLASSGRRQVYDISFSFETADYGTPVDGSRVSSEAIVNREMLDPLAIFVRDYAGNPSVQIDLVHNLEYLDEAAMELYAARFTALLDALPDCAETPLESLPVLPAEERRRVVVDFNAGLPRCSRPATVVEEFEAQVGRTPQLPAVVCGSEHLSYRELNARANRLARRLQDLGVGPETLVAACVDRSVDLVAALLGILKAGGAYVPLDPGYPRERLAFMLADSAARVVVSAGGMHDLLDLPPDCVLFDLAPETDALAVFPSGDLQRKPDPASLAYVIYTSGSTGKPKGVSITHGALAQFLAGSMELGLIRPGDRLLAVTPPSFDIAGLELFGPLLAGGTVVLAGRGETRDAEALAERFAAAKPTVMQATPASWRMLLESGWQPPSGVRLLCGGEAMAGDLAEKLLAGGSLYNLYGPTEATIWATAKAVQRPVGGAVVSIGRPFPQTRAYVLDGRMSPVGIGVAGELWLGGEQLARGYLGRPGLTAGKFVADPFGPPGSRLYRTGDLARWRPNGELEFLGRLDHQVKINGFRIELGEIEACLRSHPGVRDAVVLARDGSAGRHLVAYVTGEAEPEILRAYLQEHLPRHMVPLGVVPLDSFPLMPNGKVDRKALPAPAQPTTPEPDQAPLAPTEKGVAEIWEQVLGCGPVSRKDDFFRLGGNSLLSAGILSRIRRCFGVRVPMARFFAGPTVAQLARAVDGERRSQEEPIAPAPAMDLYPLSHAQARMWVLAQMEGGGAAYNMPVALTLEGDLDAAVLREALHGVIARHEALRTCFVIVDGAPKQKIVPTAEIRFELREEDLRDTGDPEEESNRRLREEIALPFDLARAPLMRTCLYRLADKRWLFSLVVHHIAGDGWSLGLLLKELAALYEAALDGQPAGLAPLPFAYKDYSHWMARRLEGTGFRADREFWLEKLAGPTPVLNLPADRPRPERMDFRGALRAFALSGASAKAVRAFCAERGVSPFMLLLAGVFGLLHRYTGDEDILIATPVAGRNRVDLEGQVGLYVNTLPLRVRIDPGITLAALLDRVRAAVLEAQEHQFYPFDLLIQDLKLARRTDRNPLCDVMVAMQNAPEAGFRVRGVEGIGHVVPIEASVFDLTFHFTESGGAVRLYLCYSTSLFEPERIERLAGHLERLVSALISNAGARLGEVDILGARERRQVLEEFAAGSSLPLPGKTAVDLFIEQASRTPDRTAVIFEDQRLTYRELARAAAVVAERIGESAGVQAGDVVALVAARSQWMVAGVLGIMASGAACLPIDAALPPERIRYLLEDSVCRAVVSDGSVEIGTALPVMPLAPAGAPPPRQLASRARLSDVAYITYTSGSTGAPKGSLIEHRSLANLAVGMGEALYDGLPQPSTELLLTSISFDVAQQQIFGPLTRGNTVIVAGNALRRDPKALMAAIAGQVHFVNLTPSHFAVLLAEGFGRLPKPELKAIALGAEALPAALVEAFAKEEANRHIELYNFYGPSECTVDTLFCRLKNAGTAAGGVAPIGGPFPNTRAFVLSPDFEPVPVGVPGELCLGGLPLGRGYLGRPGLTAERYVANPFGPPGSRLYRTGDLVRWRDDGRLEFLGRLDNQIKIRGFRIEPGEIEAALRVHPGVKDAAVIARDDGTGVRLVAYVTGQADREALRAHLAARLPDYMVPQGFVVLDAFPLNANGKVDRAALPAPPRELPMASRTAPRNETEALLAGLLGEVLGLAEVGIDDGFFALGGDSLMAVRLASAAERRGLKFGVQDVFQTPTVAGLAELAASKRALETANPVEHPCTPTQEGMWIARRDAPGGITYSVPALMPLEGHPAPERVREALRRLIARHEALRVVLRERDGRLVQTVMPGSEPVFEVHENGSLWQIARREIEQPFDLEHGPLARFHLCRDGQDRDVLFCNFDHLVVDGWSLGVLRRELADILAGREAELPPVAACPGKLAAMWRDTLAGGRGETLREFWRSRLERPALDPLPADAAPVSGARRLLIELDEDAAGALRTLAVRSRMTPTMIWTSAVTAVLARYKGAGRAVAVAMPFASRPSAAFENAVGCFANVLPVRVENPASLAFSDLAGAVKAEILAAMEHQEYPLSWLVRDAAAVQQDGALLFDAVAIVEDDSLLGLQKEGAEFGAGKFPLMLTLIRPDSRRAIVAIEYDAGRYTRERIERLGRHLQILVKDAAGRPEAPVARLSLLPAEERRKVIEEFNDTSRPYPRDESLASLFRAAAREHAGRTAIAHGRDRLTYSELDSRSDALARGLLRAGVAPGATVALAIGRGVTAVAATLAVVKAGCVYLPLDASLPPELTSRLMRSAGAKLIVADANGRERFAQAGATMLDVETLALEGAALPVVQRSGGDPVYVMFTSGSSGEPKGVVVPHRAVARLGLNAGVLSLTPEDAMAQAAPLGFDAATLEIWAPLLAGARIVIVDDEVALNPAALSHTLAADGVTAMFLTTSLFNRVADDAPESFRSLRRLITGGEVLSVPHARKVLEACPRLDLLNAYGPTENTTFTTLHRIAPEDLTGAIPIGRPIANTQVFVLDDALQPVPIGVWGELCVAGDGLALGYAGRDRLTAEAFVTLDDGTRIYRTGDVARWRRDGALEFGGRRDGQVKLRGRRIETGAVEAALCALPEIQDAAVLVDREVLVAVVAAGASDEPAWRAALARAVPVYMVPARFVVVPSLPITTNGKKDRRAAAALAAGNGEKVAAGRGRAPASGAEALVARLFDAIFGEKAAGVIDAESDFFHLGGHSLLAMRLAGLIEREIGTRPLIRDLLAARTVAGIAALLGQGAPVEQLPKAAGPTYPLSSGQARLWVLQRLHADSGLYNVPVALDLEGPLDVTALSRAFAGLEERQHALRLRLAPTAEDPAGMRQVLAPPGALLLEVVDLSASPDPSAAAAAERLSLEVARPFVLERDTPARAVLLKLGRERWRLVVVLHHSVCDGWSAPILLRDLAALYAGLPLAPLERGYEDFAAWQLAYLESAESKQLLERWRRRLDPVPEPLSLPTDHPRSAVRQGRGGTADLSLDAETARRLFAVASAANATPFMALLALVQTLLYRHSGQTDISVGTLSAGRDRAELADLVGFFVNTLVLRQRIDPAASFRALLEETRSTLLDAISDQDCPFEAVVDAAGAPRDTSRNPLFDVLAVWQDADPQPPALPGVTAKFVDVPFPYSKFDLEFYFQASGDGIRARVMYDSDLFEAGTVAALLRRLKALVAAALADPETAVEDLPWMPEDETGLVLHGFNATAVDLPVRQTVPQLFLAQATVHGDAKAVLADGEILTYRTFARRAGAVAMALAGQGVKPGSVVAVCARRSVDMLAAIHGILLAGAAYAPIDPDFPAARRAEILEDLGGPIVVAAADCAGLFPPDRVLTPANGEAEPVCRAGNPDELAYVIFTSGSTGRPKGVGIEHHSVLNRILWMQRTFPIGSGDVILQKTPVTFDVSVWELFWWSWTGAAVALAPLGAEKDPVALAGAVERFGVTVMHFVPSMLAEFLAALEDGRVEAAGLRGLRFVFASGEALDAALVERFNRLLHHPYGVELHNLYGPTEATVDVTWQPCSPWNGNEVVPIGRPIANTRILILGSDGRPVPVGVPGEIHIGGPQVARGYINRPELTAERFVSGPAGAGRIYRTGDSGRWLPDGAIEYLGRLDHQVKIRGFRVECGEVEHALESHPSVERAVVVPAEAGGLTELHAYVLGGAASGADLRAHLRGRLPEYMVPARFFRLDRLPLTSSGKVDRKRLSGQPLDGIVDASPQTAVQAELMAIWREVLPNASFGLNDGFFDSGGNSLLLLRLHERLERRWPGLFTVASLFACANIAEQARRIEPGGASARERDAGASQTGSAAIAIVGMSVRLADFEDLDSFWRDLAGGADRVRPLPEHRAAEARALLGALGRKAPARFREAAYLDDIYAFDPSRFRMAPADAALVDPEQRVFYEAALGALEDAGYGGTALDGRRVGVFVGAGPLQIYRQALSAALPEKAEQIFALNVPSNAATRLSFLRDWSGPAMMVDTACSAALAAVHLACAALRRGECEAALVGAAKVMPAPPDADSRLTIDSSTARTRAFAAGADGAGMGEGAVAFLLKPLEAAEADGDSIHAVILGSALNQDGASSGMAAPNPVAQASVIREAAASAGIGLDSLSYIEAHGTGTELGDPIEVEGLTRAISGKPGGIALGSVKGNYGHLDSAAGALGLAKAVLCLRHGQAPPQPFFDAPNPRIDFDRAPVAVPRSLTPLARHNGALRAGVSSFGLSGINAHVVIEAQPAAPPRDATTVDGWYVVALSAGSREALRRYAEALRNAIADDDLSISDIAHTLAAGRSHLRYRLAAAVRTRTDLMEFLAAGEAAEAPPQRGARPVVPAFAASEAEARTAVDAYLAGADLSWPAEAGRARRLHLPPAPFTRQICRPEFPGNQGAQTDRTLGAAVSTRDGHAFPVPVHAADFWPVAEHRLQGQPTLVGMAVPGLLADAVQTLGMAPELEIRDLQWIRKLRPAELAEDGVSLHLKNSNGVWQAELGGRTRSGEWVEFATATVRPLADPPVAVDIAALRRRCPVAVPLSPFTPEAGPVSVSRRWDCRAEAWTSPDQSQGLAHLRLPAAYAGDLTPYPLHPALLDVAASLALDGVPRVPAGCAAIRIFDSPSSEVLAHVIRRQAGGDALEADITLYDPANGRVRVALVGMRFLALRSETLPLATIVWRPAPLPRTAPAARVLVAGSGDRAGQLAVELSQCGCLAGRARDAAEILSSDAGDIVLAVDGGEPAWFTADFLRQLMTGLQRKLRLVIVGRRAFALDQADAIPDPEAALLAGLVLSAAQEEPMLALRYLDIDEASRAALVAAEFAAFDAAEAQPLAMLRDGRRYQRDLAPLPGGAAHWPAAGCCVVTGGLGGLSLALAEEFSGHGKLSLALLSRTGEIAGNEAEARERRERLAAFERSGNRVRCYACDVTDRVSLAATLERVRSELGPITAVVHAAGEADGGFLVNRRREAFDSVLAVKVEGARNLDALTREDPVEAFVLFASLTGLAGAPGQTAYAAANAWLDTFAEWRRRQGRPALSVDWCTLSGIGMAARHGADKLDGTAVTPAQVPQLWQRILATGSAQVVVSDPRRSAPAAPAPKPPAHAVETPARSMGMLESALSALWAEILGYDSVAPEDDYFALGGDSISGMQIVSRIQSDLGYTIKVPDLLEAGTVTAVAALLRRRAAPEEAGLKPAPEAQTYPAGWEQRDVLRAEASAEMGTAFNLPSLLEIPETLSTARLTAALTELVARHEILRTRFREEGDDWVMEVLPSSPVALPEIDLQAAADPASACRARVRPFDWKSRPPVRFELLRLPDGRRMLLFDLHHSLADGLTVELLASEIAALCAGTALPAPARQFKDYAWWSRNGGGGGARTAARDYWLGIYQGALPRLDLPADRPRPPVHTWRCGTVSFEVDPAILQRLRAFASERRVTPFVVVLSAWTALLARVAAAEDIVIGVPVDNRDHAGLETMPGMMVALLPLRLAVHGSDRIGAFLERVQAAHAGAMRHRAYGLGSLLEELAPPAAPDRTWLSEVTLSYMNFAEGAPDAGRFPLVGLPRDSVKGDLSIFVRDLPQRMLVSVEYYADLFEAERMERMASAFETLLSAMVNGPADAAVDDLPLMDAAEAMRLRAFETGAQPPLPSGRGLSALFAARARECPERIAVEDARSSWTYRQLAYYANGIARQLVEAGVRPGELVALAMERGVEAIAALVGIVTAGAGYVPLDPDYPQERNRMILADAGAAVAIADPAGRAALGSVPGITVLDSPALMKRTAEAPPAIDWPRDPDAAPAYLMYTSGSTGQPKGVLVPQRAVVRLALGDDFAELGPGDRVLQAGPLAFDASTWEVWGPLLKGGRLAIATRDEILDPAGLHAALERYGITALFLTTSLFNRQVDRDPGAFRQVRVLLTGGETMSPAHAGRLLAGCPDVRLVNIYGPTENTTFTTFYPVRREHITESGIPIGRPIAHSRVAILDASGRRTPIGVWGEICAGGPGLADGYWNRSDLTAERFIPDPEQPSERLYRTGDIGRWRPEGVIEYGGRRDAQIKLRGVRIELGEIEQALHRHEAVARAAVLFEKEELTACLVFKPGARSVSDIDMRAWLGRILPAAMVPAHWVTLPEIPVSTNGKTDRERLRAAIEGASPLGGSRTAEPPRTEAEACVAEAFTAILGRPVEDRQASFLDLGGHSLQAIRVVNWIAKNTGVRLRMADFFAAGSLAALARRVEEAAGVRENRIPPAPEADFYPASHAQQRLYLLHQMDPGSAAYNMAFAFCCDSSLDTAAFASALGGLVARHETLRTVFEEIEGAIVQRIVPQAVPAVEADDLRSHPDARAEALRLARGDVATPFDLSRAPLLRARILRVSSAETLVLLLVDHIAADGWSSRILVKELGALYRAALAGAEPGLPPLAVSYKDYAVWQSAQDWTAAAAFWRRKLAGAPDGIALPSTRPLPEMQSYRGATCRRWLPAEVMNGLRELAREHGVTLAAVGMALFAALLYRLTRQRDMVLGMGVAGRDRAELEGQIGFFVNVLPIRLELDEHLELTDLIGQTHAAMLEALDRRDYPFDLLVRDVAPRRQANRQPLVNVVFEYQQFGALDGAAGGTLPLRPASAGPEDDELAALVGSATAKHDMILFFRDDGDEGELILEHDTDILDAETAAGWLAFYCRFAGAAAAPEPSHE